MVEPTSVRELDLPGGRARAHFFEAASPAGWVVLGHGAGGGVEAADLQALAEYLPDRGWGTCLLEQPWRVSGRRVADAPAKLDANWLSAIEWLDLSGPVVFAGRSAGARVACRTATAGGAAAVLALAFPLHPPGRPERSRVAELDLAIPLQVVQGERDPFGRPDEFPAAKPVISLPGADHSFNCAAAGPLTRAEALGLLVRHTAAWLNRCALAG